MRLSLSIVSVATLGFAMALAAPEARACGGCFPPPGEQQSVVTDHRMILSVSKEQTTLYDQIQYSGSPESFAWVLPISGTVDVGLSADTLFGALQNLTATAVQAPPDRCPPPPRCDYGERSSDDSFGASADAGAAPPSVDVLKRETVGPYETVQLRSTDPAALTNWLTQNGFAIPEDIKPVIAGYVTEHFDFLALKLLPGKGVQTMRPVRVTAQGASAVLPLRMVAAGTGAVVGISLWVLGEGRYEPQNFPFFVIKSEDLLWDWGTSASNYKEIRAERTAALGGRGWEIESSLQIDRFQLRSTVTNLAGINPQAGGADYAPVEQDGKIVKTASEVREEDLITLFKGIPDGQDRVTRIRADLGRAALTTDLALIASADQAQVSNLRRPTAEKGQPVCAVYAGCEQVGTAPRDEAISRSEAAGNSESFACSTGARSSKSTPFGSSNLAGFAGLAAFLGLAFVRARRASGR